MSKIEWTDRTWSPWWFCEKIAPECGLASKDTPQGGGCYAATFAARGLHEAPDGESADDQD
jgi:protein gp37